MNLVGIFAVNAIAEMVPAAIGLARQACAEYVSNDARRGSVVDTLIQTFGVQEHIARLVVELAVFVLKHPDAVKTAPAPVPE